MAGAAAQDFLGDGAGLMDVMEEMNRPGESPDRNVYRLRLGIADPDV